MDKLLEDAEKMGINFRFDPTGKEPYVIETTARYGVEHRWTRDTAGGVRGLIRTLMMSKDRVVAQLGKT